MTITIVSAGLTIFQDKGRARYVNLGVPLSGAFDAVSHQLASNLIDEPDGPVLEILRGPFQLKTSLPVILAVVGEAKVTVDGSLAPVNSVFVLAPDKRLEVKLEASGPAYLAIKGLMVSKTLDSYSYDTLSHFGPPPLQNQDSFETEEMNRFDPLIGSFISSSLKSASSELRYIPGPQNIEINTNWQIESVARSGIRLAGHSPVQNSLSALASFPVMPGAIQVPPSGLPVILGVDCGTTGGYPVAGVLIEADLHKLARLAADSQIALMPVNQAFAATAWSNLAKSLANSITRPNDMGAW
jgi:allophanate hydrolase subunit 2